MRLRSCSASVPCVTASSANPSCGGAAEGSLIRTQGGGGTRPSAVGSCPISAWQRKGSVIARWSACAECTSLHSVQEHAGGARMRADGRCGPAERDALMRSVSS